MRVFGALVVLFFCIQLFANAQKQGNQWVFPNNNTLNFNSVPPEFSVGGAIGCSSSDFCEGVASVADSSGSLLFYSDGTAVWDSNHQIIANGDGLLGHRSSTNAAYVLPFPNSNTQFYLFTTDGKENNLENGLRYNVIELCGESNLRVTEKNVLLRNNVTEKLCATRNGNGQDYWLLAHERGSDRFLCYSITINGIELTDSMAVGVVHPSAANGAVGQMKFSPNGDRIVSTISNTPNPGIELFDFDNQTGAITQPIFFNPDTLEGFPMPFYGLSFSPDGEKLYASPVYWERIYQVDLSQSASSQELVNSSVLLNNVWNSPFGVHQIQLGPDGKIYVASRGKPYLAVVNFPNQIGLACDFDPQGVDLLGNVSGWGLPAFVDNFDYSATGVCDTGVGIEAFADKGELKVYPNPTTSQLNINLSPNQRATAIGMFDLLGREVLHQPFATQVDVSQLPAGNYILEVQTAEGVLRKRVVVE
mgnify:CR=1 FL=1